MAASRLELRATVTFVALGGAIAQLGERVVRNDEVGGSIPPGSTIRLLKLRRTSPSARMPVEAQRAKTGFRFPSYDRSTPCGARSKSTVAASIGIRISQR